MQITKRDFLLIILKIQSFLKRQKINRSKYKSKNYCKDMKAWWKMAWHLAFVLVLGIVHNPSASTPTWQNRDDTHQMTSEVIYMKDQIIRDFVDTNTYKTTSAPVAKVTLDPYHCTLYSESFIFGL